MNFSILDTVIFRVPQFPADATLKECWDELKKSIAIASKEFYSYIEHTAYEEYDDLPDEYKTTIQKYFNRARFRATPYGTFAGFGLCGLTKDKDSLRIGTDQVAHRFTDWKYSKDTNREIAHLDPEELILQSNSSYYRIGNAIRYLAVQEGKQSFSLTDIDHDPTIQQILEVCSPKATARELMQTLNVDTETLYAWIEELAEAQLIYTHLHPNIIGQDYFARIGLPDEREADAYIITQRKALNGGLSGQVLKNLGQAVTLLQSIRPEAKDTEDLQTFIRRFSHKYEQQYVPLLQALDPETGIGYGELEQAHGISDLVTDIVHNSADVKKQTSSLLKEYLAGQLALSGHAIVLDDFALPEKGIGRISNTISAIVSLYDDTLLLEHIGGCTANALIGRFSLADEAVTDLAKRIAQIEQGANPDVIFFDIAYLGELHVDNINRRQHIYDAQLALLNYNTSGLPVSLNDLYLTMRGNELILFSRSLQKRMVPRVSTAYNHSRSDLPVFRFLCDLQYHGLQTDISFDPERLYSGLNSYPTIRYKNIILSPAKWKVSLKALSPDLPLQSLKDYLTGLGVAKRVKLGMADQTLLLDISEPGDLSLLLSILQKRKEVWLTGIPEQQEYPVRDADNRPYTAEFVLSLFHGQKIYPGIDVSEYGPTKPVQRVFPPGSEWLYIELFCHPSCSNGLLLDEISQLLRNCAPFIQHWFFIRYFEDGHHLRLRFRLKKTRYINQLAGWLSELLAEKIGSGIVSEVQYCTYRRELERYAHADMDAVEQHFCHDSRYVLQLIEAGATEWERYRMCAELVNGLIQKLPSLDFGAIISRMCNRYCLEHRIDRKGFKKINRHYKEKWLSPDTGSAKTCQHLLSFDTFVHSFAQLLSGCSPSRREALFADLFHMHINRLFEQHQRTHELLIYYFLEKDCLRQQKYQRTKNTM